VKLRRLVSSSNLQSTPQSSEFIDIQSTVMMSSLTEQTGSSVMATGNKSRVYTIDDILGRRSSNVDPIVPAKLIGMNLIGII
jgi:hypothetical protein